MDIQTGIVLVCVAAAVIFMGRKVWRSLRGGCGCGCGGSDGKRRPG